VKNVWAKLGSNDAISWFSVGLVGLVSVFGSLALANVETAGRELLFMSLSLCSVACLALVLWMGRGILTRTSLGKLRPLVTIITFAIALVVRAVSFDYLLVAFSFSDLAQPLYRINSSLLTVGGGLILSAYLVVSSREIARSRQSLDLVQRRLDEATSNADLLISSRKTQLLNEIRESISAQLGSPLGRDNRLQALLDDVVRPVSHRLFREFESVLHEPKEIEVKRVDWSTLFRHAMLSRTTHPLAFGVWIGWTALNMLPAISPETGLFAALVVIGFMIVLLPLVEMIWQKLPTDTSPVARAGIFTVLYTCLDLVLVFTLEATSEVSLTEPARLLATVFSVVVAAWSIALGFSGASLLSEINKSLELANTELRRQIAALNGAARAFQERVSRLLHGPIQDTIAQAIYKSEVSKVNSTDLVMKIRGQIEALIDGLDNYNRNFRSVEVFLKELAEMWDGVVRVSTCLEESANRQLIYDEAASGTVIEIVREGCSNAIRHGDALEVNVSINLHPETRQIEIEITNTGAGLERILVPGLGTQLLNQLCSEWSRRQVGTLVTLKCLIPLSVKAPA
jgi:hypothetical protein